MDQRQRLLVPITYGFSVRYLLPTDLLNALKDVCEPVVGLGWVDHDLDEVMQGAGIETIQLPEAHLEHRYRMHRRRMEIVHQRRLASPTSRIAAARKVAATSTSRARLIGRARRAADRVAMSMPGAAEAALQEEPALITESTNVGAFGELLRDRRIDAVLSLTPYHDQDALLLWAARAGGLGTCSSIISFDNPTTRGRLLVQTDRTMVWNRYNEDELLRADPHLDASSVRIIGAPQFDLHHRSDLVLDRREWSSAFSIPEDRPVILHGAGPSPLVPGERRLIAQIDDDIAAGRISDEPFLLVRRHPTDPPGPWHELDRCLRHGRVVDPWPTGPNTFRSWPGRDDLIAQMSSLAHADVHVNVCSSMTLDGAVFDRPQVGPSYVPGATRSESRSVRSLYEQEHWQPIARSGGIAPAGSHDELVEEINAGLRQPQERRSARRDMVADVLTFVDGCSSGRLVEEVRRWGSTTVERPSG